MICLIILPFMRGKEINHFLIIGYDLVEKIEDYKYNFGEYPASLNDIIL